VLRQYDPAKGPRTEKSELVVLRKEVVEVLAETEVCHAPEQHLLTLEEDPSLTCSEWLENECLQGFCSVNGEALCEALELDQSKANHGLLGAFVSRQDQIITQYPESVVFELPALGE
jgi:hypothetical protein